MDTTGNVIFAIGFSFMMYFMIIRPWINKISGFKNLGILLNEPTINRRLDQSYQQYLDTLLSWLKLAIPTAVLGIIFVSVLGLYFWKLSQTSNFALQYDRQAHYEMGQWIIAMGLSGGAALLLKFMGEIPAKKSFDEALDVLKRELKVALAYAQDHSQTLDVINIQEFLAKLQTLTHWDIFKNFNAALLADGSRSTVYPSEDVNNTEEKKPELDTAVSDMSPEEKREIARTYAIPGVMEKKVQGVTKYTFGKEIYDDRATADQKRDEAIANAVKE